MSHRLPTPADITDDDPQRRQIANVAARIADEAVDAYCAFEAAGLDNLKRATHMSLLLRAWMDAIEGLYGEWQQERDSAWQKDE